MKAAVILRTALVAAATVTAAFAIYSQDQAAAPTPAVEPQGIPPRASPADYQTHAQAGDVTIAAEFVGHYVPTPEGTLTAEDYVAIEVAFFGQAGSHVTLSPRDFSLRINGRKAPLPSEPYTLVARGLKDPDWEMTVAKPKSKGDSEETPGIQGGPKPTPTPIKYPIEVQRAMARRTHRASLAEGDRPLPQAGLIFFSYRGKPSDIRSLELIYGGPAGHATLALQPYGA